MHSLNTFIHNNVDSNSTIMSQDAKEKVDLFLSATCLPRQKHMRDNNSFAVIYLKNTKSGELSKIATTDVIKGNNDPTWAATYTVEYLFEVKQEIIVRVFDRESAAKDINIESNHNFIGEVEVTLSLLCKNEKMELNLLRGAKGTGGILTIRAEKQAYVNDTFCVTFAARKLNSGRAFFQPTPFIQISRKNEANTFVPIWHSVVKKSTSSPTWEPIRIPMTTLCNGDRYCPLLFEVLDFDRNGKNKFVGSFETSVKVLEEDAKVGKEYILVDAKRSGHGGYVNSGILRLNNLNIESKPTFLDYLGPGGCELSLVVAIDFTASNKPYTDPTSLHHLDPRGGLNDYEKVIESVGSVLAGYDTDNKFSVLGFGARLESPVGPIEHCFNVSETDEEVYGVDGIKQVPYLMRCNQPCNVYVTMPELFDSSKAYRGRVSKLHFLGPSFFAPIIMEGARIAAAGSKSKQQYTILLILTDGCIHDLDRTLDAIRFASQKPLSVVITGVGNADFSSMYALEQCEDADRDIVHFLRYNDVADKPQSVLTTEVLKKVPTQLLEYMASRSIEPHSF